MLLNTNFALFSGTETPRFAKASRGKRTLTLQSSAHKVPRLGFEPRLIGPEPIVLPLDDPGLKHYFHLGLPQTTKFFINFQ